jgi:TrmH family RNA methyltransferase
LQKRSARWSERAFVVEGAELLRIALRAGLPVESVYVAPGAGGAIDKDAQAACQQAMAAGARLFQLAPGVLERVADTVTPQPVLAVLPMLEHAEADLPATPSPGSLLVVMVDVRDPGNAGTVLRTADASGAAGVVFSADSVDPYNPKTVRASAGSLFHVPFWVVPDAPGLAATLSGAGYRTLAAAAGGAVAYDQLDWSLPSALFLGNESAGLNPATRKATSSLLTIPMEGKAESLNVGVACAVVCFEALRQRRAGGATA